MTKLKDGIYMTNTFAKSVMYLEELSEKNFQYALTVSESKDDTRARIIVVVDNKIRAVRIPGMLDWKNDDSVPALTLEASLAAFEEKDDDDFEVEYVILATYITAMDTRSTTFAEFVDGWLM
jgi:hypothetical protein